MESQPTKLAKGTTGHTEKVVVTSLAAFTCSSEDGMTLIIFINVYYVAPLPVVVGEGIMSDASELSVASRVRGIGVIFTLT